MRFYWRVGCGGGDPDWPASLKMQETLLMSIIFYSEDFRKQINPLMRKFGLSIAALLLK